MPPSVKLVSRALGKNGPAVPRLGLGLMNNSGAYNDVSPDEERLAFLDKAYALGETFWDSADMYSDSEDLLGKWFKANPDKRKDIFLATKFGIDMKSASDFRIDSSPEYCRKAFAKSISRLGVDYVDLYYVHRLDGVTPVEKTMEVLVELKNAGKIRHIGLSACSAASLRRAHAVHPITAVQMEYNVFDTTIESPDRKVLETARELGVAIVAYSPLGRGILSGGENLQTNLGLVKQLTDLATSHGLTTAQLCLAWLLAQGDDVFAIPGTRSAERLEQNLLALNATLSPEDEKKIRNLGTQVAGSSHIEHLDKFQFGDTPEL